jgi:hypothetical protein
MSAAPDSEDEPQPDEVGAPEQNGEPPVDDGYGDEADATSDEPAEAPAGEPLDQLGIPNDVRGDGEQHARLAMGCSLLTVGLVAAFWLWRWVF